MATAPVAATDEPETRQLLRKVKAGVGWSLANSVSARVLTVGLGMVIAHLLTPETYGIYAVGFLVLTAITSMNELGVSVAVVRWPTDPTALTPTACTISIATSIVLYIAIFMSAPPIAAALGTPSAALVIRVVALNVVLDGISSTPAALLTRSFHQGRRAIVDIAAFVPAAGITIGLAASGWGALSLAWGSLAGNVTAVTMVYVLAPDRPRPGWNREHAKALLRSGLPFGATSALYLATLNVDYVVVGHALGTTALGLYVLAFNISSWPANLVSLSIRRVAIPGFSQIAHRTAELGKAFTRSLHLVAGVAILVSVLLAMLAQPLVTIFYGHNWLPAVTVLRWLALLGAARVMFDLVYDVLVATGRGRALLLAQGIWCLALVVLLPLFASAGGIRGVGIGHVVVVIAVVAPVYVVALGRAGLPLRSVVATLAGPATAGVVTAGVMLAALQLRWGPWTRLLLIGSAATVVYLVILALQRENRSQLGRMLAR
jgi:PST family polysaccharide transporter